MKAELATFVVLLILLGTVAFSMKWIVLAVFSIIANPLAWLAGAIVFLAILRAL
jgi:hypothetical protein